MTEETLALTLPWHLRARMWLTHPATWVQVGSFLAVGGVGYVVNLAIYALAVHALRLDYRDSAVVAFAVALTTTFVLNRRYTFGATNGEMHQQAWRYVLVSGVAPRRPRRATGEIRVCVESRDSFIAVAPATSARK